MGLDMYLYACQKDASIVDAEDYISRVYDRGLGEELNEQVGYWRKANQIHGWFVANVQGGDDSCLPYFVEKKNLENLKLLCKEALELKKFAPILLPAREGFFFGSDVYDEHYYGQLQETIEIIDKVLNEVDFDSSVIIYQSSW
jgi:hypothetical protein